MKERTKDKKYIYLKNDHRIFQATPHCFKIKMDSNISDHLLIFASLGNCSQTFITLMV